MIETNNVMNFTDADVAKSIAKQMANPTFTKKEYAVQLFLEALVLPNDCSSYSDDKLEEYILDFMNRVYPNIQ